MRRGYEIPPSSVSRELGLPPGETILYFLRVHSKFVGCRAAIKRYIKSDAISSTSLRQRIEPDLIGDFSHGWVEAIPAEARFAGLLRVEVDVPLMSLWWVERIGGLPSICSHMIFGGNEIALAF